MKNKILSTLVGLALGLAVNAQSSFPPNKYPESIKVFTKEEVAQYWNVKRVMCLGRSGAGYKFRIFGKGEANMPEKKIYLYYVLPDFTRQSTGAYVFPRIKKGEPFSFEIVCRTPAEFLGFDISDDASLPKISTPPPLPDSPVTVEIMEIVEDVETVETEDEVYQVTQVSPMFIGGDRALLHYIEQNLRYPLVAKENGIQGRVLVKCVIEKDGSVSNVAVQKGVNPSLDEEAVRLVKSLPKFTPGKVNNKAVRTFYILPITFRQMEQKGQEILEKPFIGVWRYKNKEDMADSEGLENETSMILNLYEKFVPDGEDEPQYGVIAARYCSDNGLDKSTSYTITDAKIQNNQALIEFMSWNSGDVYSAVLVFDDRTRTISMQNIKEKEKEDLSDEEDEISLWTDNMPDQGIYNLVKRSTSYEH